MKEVNPLKLLRQRAGLTMQEVADFACVSRQYAIRAEQAVFKEVPKTYVQGLLELVDGPQDLETLALEYEHWQRLRREESFGALTPGFDFHKHSPETHEIQDPMERLGPVHPFTHWRHHSGLTARIAVSKLFCVHPALIFKFEEQPWLCTTPPSELLVALKQSGYHPDDLLNFQNAYQVFRADRREAMLHV